MYCICGQWHWKKNKAHEIGSRADKYNNTGIISVTHLFSWLVIVCNSHWFIYYFKIKFIWQIACVHVWYTKKKKKPFPFSTSFCAGMLRKILSFPQSVFLASFQAPIWYRNQIKNMSFPICNQLKTGISLEPEDKGKHNKTSILKNLSQFYFVYELYKFFQTFGSQSLSKWLQCNALSTSSLNKCFCLQ